VGEVVFGVGKHMDGATRQSADRLTVIAVDQVRVSRVLWMATAVLVVLDVAASVAAGLNAVPWNLTRFFDADYKVNFPTGAKTFLLLAATLLLLGCWWCARKQRHESARGWILLAGCTGFAFVDETTYLHQSLAEVMRSRYDFEGVLAYAWTVVYWPVAALASVFLLRNLRTMHPRVRNLLLPGGVLYASGALLFEPVKSQLAETYGEGSLQLKLSAATSDSLQLIGLTLLVCSLIRAAGYLTDGFSFVFERRRAPVKGPGSAAARGAQTAIDIRHEDHPADHPAERPIISRPR
jgi:hypothetical protein